MRTSLPGGSPKNRAKESCMYMNLCIIQVGNGVYLCAYFILSIFIPISLYLFILFTVISISSIIYQAINQFKTMSDGQYKEVHFQQSPLPSKSTSFSDKCLHWTMIGIHAQVKILYMENH